MPNHQNRRLRLRGIRDVYLLVGECRALGGDGMRWRQHLVTRSRKLFDADVALFGEAVMQGERWSNQGWMKPISIIGDWVNEESQRFFWRFIRRGRAEDSALGTIASELLASKSGIRVMARRDMMSEEDWHANSFFQQEPTKVRMDDFVMGALAGKGTGEGRLIQMLMVQRAQGREPFSRRHVQAVKAIVIELAKLQPHELSGLDDSAFMTLPPRMLQVLACLLGGSTVKEAAKMLDISAHTVQEHVKRLYQRTGSSNRAELAEFYRPVASSILEMGLEDMPNHQQRLQKAMRKPWPTGPRLDD